LRKEGLIVLGISRPDGNYLGAPDGETTVNGDDVLLEPVSNWLGYGGQPCCYLLATYVLAMPINWDREQGERPAVPAQTADIFLRILIRRQGTCNWVRGLKMD
jgi:hypothetical protein